MKKLFKVTTVQIDGFQRNEIESNSYLISDLDYIVNDKAFTQEDVVEADVVFLEYNKYKKLGNITEEEIQTLKKFKII